MEPFLLGKGKGTDTSRNRFLISVILKPGGGGATRFQGDQRTAICGSDLHIYDGTFTDRWQRRAMFLGPRSTWGEGPRRRFARDKNAAALMKVAIE